MSQIVAFLTLIVQVMNVALGELGRAFLGNVNVRIKFK